MNQKCKVCHEPAAGFHFGAFTCEGCKSFFGRSYNNLNSITECKNNGECVINKKNRTACKACRLRKCLMVGMSKSGSRYGRRSNWFKIHCLLQEQQQAAQASPPRPHALSAPHAPPHPHSLASPFPPHLFPTLARPRKDEFLLALDDYRPTCTGSPDSARGSPHEDPKRVPDLSDPRRSPPRDFMPLQLSGLGSLAHFPHSPFLPPPPFGPFGGAHPLLFPGGFHPALYPRALLAAADNNNDARLDDHNSEAKRPKPHAPRSPHSLHSPRAPHTPRTPDTPPVERAASASPVQENPIDLSVRATELRCSPARSRSAGGESTPRRASSSEDETTPAAPRLDRVKLHPLDLTTRV